MAAAVTATGRPQVLRVAAVWGTTVVGLRTLSRGESFELGADFRNAFCESVGLDYVSASPYRVPIARLAAAQAALGK